MNAPRIIVNTVSWTDLENFFLSKVTDSKGIQSTICLGAACERQTPRSLDVSWSYFSRNPSASMVNKMENLLRTVNMGKLWGGGGRTSNMSTFGASKLPKGPNVNTYFSLLVPIRPVI